ncbi:MAG TPA: DinB family protein [Thermoanaerobaculia bacterium]
MSPRKSLLGFLILMACAGLALAQGDAPGVRPTVSQLEDRFVGAAEREVVPAADAMPEEKYSFAPTNGEFTKVRTFAEMVKHVAASNYGMAAAILHEKPPVKLETQSDLDAIRTKAEIMTFLRGSFAFLHRALSSINEKNQTELIRSPDSDKPLARLEVADRALWHCNNHYGQMVMYLRMNGIVPPASRHTG